MSEGPWIQTVTGRRASVEMAVEDVSIEDIAHSLAHICRFAGHTREFYSVAQHSCLAYDLSDGLDPVLRRNALLHDAAEAYTGDIPRPVKIAIGPRIKAIEGEFALKVAMRFGIVWPTPEPVKEIDERLLFTERAQLLPVHVEWGWSREPYPIVITPWPPERARREFLDRWIEVKP